MKRSLLERLYRTPVGRLMSSVARAWARLHRPFMVYGYYDHGSKSFRKYTRISSDVVILNERELSVGEDVWVWHHTILDATEGLTIGDGCQIGAWVGIFTHGSENSIRLLGKQFVHIHNTERMGYSRSRVEIGAYTFIGAGSVVLPGVTLGRGCLIAAGTLLTKSVPDYSIVAGVPGRIKGSTLETDERFFREQDYSSTYYDAEALQEIRNRLKESEEHAHQSENGGSD